MCWSQVKPELEADPEAELDAFLAGNLGGAVINKCDNAASLSSPYLVTSMA
jgi:hypothetical protein